MAAGLQYRNLRDLNRCVADNLHRLPRDIDVVVGVPRSGMLAATMVGLYLDVPVSDVDRFLRGEVMPGGDRATRIPDRPFRRALIVDDAIHTGRQLRLVRDALESSTLSAEPVYCCVYAHPDRMADVDIHFETLEGHRWLFEWNKLNHGMVPSMCVDMDGVLCRDPEPHEDDDAEAYLRFIETAEPKFRPRRKIGWIVTSRLEKYRKPTEDWLRRHEIEYGELHMMDLPSRRERTPWLSI